MEPKSSHRYFNILPQFYGFQPVDEVIRRSRTGIARSGNATGFNPWLFTDNLILRKNIMYRKLMYFTSFALVLSLVSMVPAQDTADVLIHYPYISIPVIDGFVDDVWSISTQQPINVHINGDPPSGASDCSGTWRALWDWEYLYVLVEVKDEMLLHDSTYNRSWEDDSVEVYVDGDNSKRISVDENDHQYCFRWYNQVETPRAQHHGELSLEGVEYAVHTNSNGYLFEIRLPWVSIMGKQPTAGQLIGFDVFINDDDDRGSRDTQISWYATDGTGWNTPSMWGTGLLMANTEEGDIAPSNNVYYVDMDAPGNNDGSSWANAYWCLQDALASARSGDEIRVAEGIHKPDQQIVRTGHMEPQVRSSGNRRASFELKRGVTIKGGYAGFGKQQPDERDIDSYKTILSGDLNGNDWFDFTDNSENSFHVVVGSRTNPTDVLEGFIITGGNANGPPPFDCGGGIFIDDTGNLKILNCTFTGNSAEEKGGGIYCTKSSPTIENCTIIGNLAYYYGGGILCETSLRISNCVIAGNSAMYGGAIYCFDSSTTITNCTIVGNYTSEYGGGGIYCGNSSPTVVNTILWNDIPDEIYLKHSSINVVYSNIQGGWPGTGNIDTNPLFVDAAGADNFIGTEDDNLRLLPDSPCIDAGDNSAIPAGLTVDIDGNPRIAGGIVDMGAYEGGMVLTTGIYYVDMDAPGNNDGSSWADAFRRLQDALSAAHYGDEIRVAKGIYRPDQGLGQTSGNREASFRLENGLTIKGGYAGFGEADPNARDLETYNTILSGDLNGDDGPHFANNSENSYLVVVCIECNESVMLDGFTITGGNATSDYIAGGMLNYESSPIVKNCNFSRNSAGQGGGMANRHSNPTVTNCIFSGNATVYGGGGMYNTDGSNPVVTDCIFIENSASMLGGGGMYNGDSSPTVTNCRFTGNYAMFGGGMYNVGGSSTTVTNCTFSENRVSAWGGGMQNEAGAMPTVTNCILWGDIPDEIAFSGSATVTHSDVEGGWTGIGNIALDPKFADAEGRLSFDSPCIDAGSNDAVPSDVTTDLDGNPRIVNGTVDMGAYERGPRLWASDPSPADGAIIGQRTPVLRWTPGDTTVKYDVYFGTALDGVQDADISDQSGIYRGRCIDPSYITEELELDGTYYWRIDEVEADGEIIHKGDVWSFTIVDRITVEYRVSSSEDDAYATNNNLQSVNAEYLKVGSSTFASPPYYMSGMVFRNVTVPRDARILSAHLKIRSYNSRLTGSVYGIIKAEAADDTAAFDNYHHVDSLSTTVNSVIWDHDEPWLEDTWYESPDLVDVVQEVISRQGWSSGNSLTILYSTRSEGDYRNFSSYDRGSGFAPELEITYAPK